MAASFQLHLEGTAMPELIESILEEHRTIAEILSVLERQVDLFERNMICLSYVQNQQSWEPKYKCCLDLWRLSEG